MSLPTKTAEMREQIILTLAKLHFEAPAEGEGYLDSDIQFAMWDRLVGDDSWWGGSEFGDRSSTGRAFERAMTSLRADGTVVIHPDDPNDIEKVLAVFLETRNV